MSFSTKCREFDPDSPLDVLGCINIVIESNFFFLEIAAYFYDQNEATKAPKLEPLQKETVPFYLSRLDKIVAENGGYFVGGQVCV